MLWQEIIFFTAFLILAGFTYFTVADATARNIPYMGKQWTVYLYALSAFIVILVFVLFSCRIRAFYSHREIEEIQIFDRSQKSSLDFDSPAILSVYFEDIKNYENEKKYYKKSIFDRFDKDAEYLIGSPLQKIRKMIEELETATANDNKVQFNRTLQRSEIRS